MSVLDAAEAALLEGDMVLADKILLELSSLLEGPTAEEAERVSSRIANLTRLARQQRQKTKTRLQELNGVRAGTAQYEQVALSR